jgi:hypothetical protein
MAGGRAIIVAAITIAAPQAGQMIAGRCFSLRTRARQGATRSTSCRKRTSFLLHAWRKPYDLERTRLDCVRNEQQSEPVVGRAR